MLPLKTGCCRLFVRCERQTLAKLPTSGAVQFTIRTYVRPLREYLGKSPDTLKRLRHAIAEMPDIWVSRQAVEATFETSYSCGGTMLGGGGKGWFREQLWLDGATTHTRQLLPC